MKTITLSGSQRTKIGKLENKNLRRTGKVPCVLYGGKENLHFETIEKDFKNIVYTPDIHLVKLEVGGTHKDAILKDIQFHPVTDSILHVDFLEVFPDKPVVMDIPVRFVGTSIGVREGGQMLKKLNKIRLQGIISKIPDTIEINIEALKIGDLVKIADLKYDGVSFLHDPAVTIVSIKKTRVVVAAVPVVAAAAAPEAAAAAPGAAATPVKEEKKAEKKK